MKMSAKLTLISLAVCLLGSNIATATPAIALQPQAKQTNTPVSMPTITPTPPAIDAKSYVVMDANSGIVIASKNMHQQLPPASLTKLMTMYVASQALRDGRIHLDDDVYISKKAWQMGGSRMFLQVGSNVKVQDLIEGIIIASGNDACVAIAEHIAGSEDSFAQLMNENAKRLGMQDTHYIDSTGLPNPNHHSSAYDLAVLSRAVINDYPEDYQWYRQKWITYNGIKQPNRNRLLWRDPSVDGLKTGHTDEAGFCLVASAKRNDMRLISVVLGTPSDGARSNDSQALLNWGFRFYESHKLFSANQPLAQPRTWLGESKNTALGLTQDFYATIPVNQYQNLKATMDLPTELRAPLIKGQAYGSITVTLNGNVVAKQPLVALTDNPQAGFFKRMVDHIVMLFSGWL